MQGKVRKKSRLPKADGEQWLDPNVLLLLQQRDAAFLEAIFFEINPYLMRVCLSCGIYNDDVSELIHQTWEQFFLRIEKFEGRSQIRTFICGIMFNKIREFRRIQKRLILDNVRKRASPQGNIHKWTSC